MEKMNRIPSSNLSAKFSANKLIFEKPDKRKNMQESENIVNGESIGLISVSPSLSTISETDQSQARTGTGGRDDIESLMSNQQ